MLVFAGGSSKLRSAQVNYSEGGARKRAREEAAARREASILRSQPRAALTMTFPWHRLSPGARFTAVVRNTSAVVQ